MMEASDSVASQAVSGYPKELFQGSIDPKFVCNFCSGILHDPVQSFCGHRFCRACIEGVVSSGDQRRCLICEKDGELGDYSLLKEDQMFPDNAVKREMASLQAVCPNSGCTWTGTFKEYEAKRHFDECEHRPVACQSCGQLLSRSLMQEHMERNCPNRTITCKFCRTNVVHKELERHSVLCPKHPLKCDGCGRKKIPRDQMQQHMDSECPNQKVQCPAGCGLSEYDTQQAANESEIRAQLDLCALFIEDINSTITRLEQGICTALSSYVRHCITRKQALQAEIEALKQRDDATSQKLQSLQREVNQQHAAFNNMSARMTIQENTSYDGTLMWKISNYTAKLQRATNGEDVCLYSPPFHTSRYGTKMRALIYLNGIGNGKHISLYFVVMRGEYDAIQKWPFQQRVSFYLINPKSWVRDIVKNSFQSDPTHAAFQRPGSEMNAAIGYRKFIRKELVYEFVRDDTMFIEICVDTTNLSTIP